MKDFLENFQWHSSVGLDESMLNTKKAFKSLLNTKQARSQFIVAGDNLLIHKTTSALWKLSKDKKTIIPVFDTDILTEEDINEK